MCDPMTALGAAATLGGTYYNQQTQRRHVDAVNEQNRLAFEASEEARRAEQARQDGMRKQNRATFMDTAQQVDPGKEREQLDGRQAANLAENEALRSLAMPGWLDGAGTGGTTNTSDRANRRVESREGQHKAQNRLRGAGQLAPGSNFALARGAADMGFTRGNMRGSAGVADQERSIGPAQVMPGDGLLGDLLLAGGGLGLQRGGFKRGKAATSQNPPSTSFGGMY